jgi:hypothetical protein
MSVFVKALDTYGKAVDTFADAVLGRPRSSYPEDEEALGLRTREHQRLLSCVEGVSDSNSIDNDLQAVFNDFCIAFDKVKDEVECEQRQY